MLIILIIAVMLLASGIIFKKTAGKLDKRTCIYIAVFSLVALATSAGMWFLYEKKQLPIFQIFLLALAVFFISGLLHFNSMFRLIWARRDSYVWQRDSFSREIAFTAGLSLLMTLLALVPFGYMVNKLNMAMSMSGLLLVFPLPFLVAKCYDMFAQVPDKEFDKKWFYEIYPFDETQWKRENMVSIGFEVTDSVENEKKWFHKKAKFTIVVPRDQELRLIFRLALREYDKKPSVPVQELGYEENIKPFWWLFKARFIWWKPNTWKHYQKYLDPHETLSFNNVKNGDFVKAKRIILDQNNQN